MRSSSTAGPSLSTTAGASRAVRVVDLPGRALGALLLGAIRLYQLLLSPMLGPRCRYHPSCSTYAAGAIRVHGPFKGLALGAARLCRCNPWSGGGFDPVPSRGHWRSSPDEVGA